MPESICGTIQPDNPPKGWKKFYGDFIVGSDGTIFLPYTFSGCSQSEVFLCASFDGVPIMQLDNISFFPTDWLKSEFPKMKAIDSALKAIEDARQKKLGPFAPL